MTQPAPNGKLWKHCPPEPGLPFCFEVSVFVAGPPDRLWYYLGDISNMSEFFPSLQFKREQSGALVVGEIYRTKLSFEKTWSRYKVLAVAPDRRLSAEMMDRYWFLTGMRYDHRLVPVEGGTLSVEKIGYGVAGGWWAKLIDAVLAGPMLRKTNISAHLKLKQIIEAQARPKST
jgi:polyketide cyclase/dehydrase/lipid transport protein